MSQTTVIGVGVIGLGFMGATHVAAYHAAARDGFACQLVAVADPKESRRRGNLSDVGGNIATTDSPQLAFDLSQVKGYERAEDLLDAPAIDLVSICTRTDTHVELAIAALRAGKHVLVEKPVALRPDDIRKIEEVARQSARLCMPAMCMRFWPGWSWLKQAIESRTYGTCLSATFHRLASPPTWSRDFYRNGKRSGGALVDLHIHDADFVRFCFGAPDAVSSAGRIGDSGAIDHVTTLYHYRHANGPPHVAAEGGWDHSAGFPLTMRYVAIFEHATAEFDLARQHPLLLYRAGRSEVVKLDPLTGHDGEIRHMVQSIVEGRAQTDVTLADAIATMELLDLERKSVEHRDTRSAHASNLRE